MIRSKSGVALGLVRLLPIVWGGAVASGIVLSACSEKFSSCEETHTCTLSTAGASGAGPSAGEGGEPTNGGAPSGAGTSAGSSDLGGSAGDPETGGDAGAGGDVQVSPLCGNGRLDSGEDCDDGAGNAENAYGSNKCTTACKVAPYCGDNKKSGPEACDEGGAGVELGTCNPECTGYYEKKYIRATNTMWAAGSLGGIAGADAKCVAEIGTGWKALLVGGTRRATKTPLRGDDAQDWVIHKYTHYYSFHENKLIWRTDDLALLGVRDGARVNLYADAFKVVSQYPWSGWRSDWTTFEDDVNNQGTCGGWTSTTKESASFAFGDLKQALSESCSSSSFILCVEQ